MTPCSVVLKLSPLVVILVDENDQYSPEDSAVGARANTTFKELRLKLPVMIKASLNYRNGSAAHNCCNGTSIPEIYRFVLLFSRFARHQFRFSLLFFCNYAQYHRLIYRILFPSLSRVRISNRSSSVEDHPLVR